MAITQRDVFTHVTQNGPVVAAAIASDLGVDSYLIGAYLSELTESKQVFLTKSTAAGSPLYYVAEQHPRIVVLRDKLKEKDRRTFDLLQERGVLRSDELEPLTRISLQNLPDFAHPLNIKMGEQTVEYYKWFLLSNDEVVSLLQKRYASSKPATPAASKAQSEPLPLEQEQLPLESLPTDSSLTTLSFTEVKNTDDVISQIEKANIRISSSVDIKKNKECDCIMSIPTAFGLQKYFVKILFKKKITDTDLQTVYLQGTLKHMPICLLTNGILTKKAELCLNSDLASLLFVHL